MARAPAKHRNQRSTCPRLPSFRVPPVEVKSCIQCSRRPGPVRLSRRHPEPTTRSALAARSCPAPSLRTGRDQRRGVRGREKARSVTEATRQPLAFPRAEPYNTLVCHPRRHQDRPSVAIPPRAMSRMKPPGRRTERRKCAWGLQATKYLRRRYSWPVEHSGIIRRSFRAFVISCFRGCCCLCGARTRRQILLEVVRQ
jgi:hypothetical protein